jgi:ubiquinone/menaquinone biosynthesis C-methylase UbiE
MTTSTNTTRSFDRLARIYRGLEWLAFGSELEATRFGQLECLAGCRRVLILGEGDGRFLARLTRRFPEMEVECVDISRAMLERAARRLDETARARVTFRHEDARTAELGEGRFDAVVTLFFLDCFTDAEAGAVVARIGRALRPEARWLWADFALPARGWRRARARAWLGVLFFFFRWQTGMSARRLPQVRRLIEAQGFAVAEETVRQAGLLRSAFFSRRLLERQDHRAHGD